MGGKGGREGRDGRKGKGKEGKGRREGGYKRKTHTSRALRRHLEGKQAWRGRYEGLARDKEERGDEMDGRMMKRWWDGEKKGMRERKIERVRHLQKRIKKLIHVRRERGKKIVRKRIKYGGDAVMHKHKHHTDPTETRRTSSPFHP